MAIETQHHDEQDRQSVRRTRSSVQFGCGKVTCKREGNRIVLIAGPGCQLAASGGLDMVTVAVRSKSKEVEKPEAIVVVAIA